MLKLYKVKVNVEDTFEVEAENEDDARDLAVEEMEQALRWVTNYDVQVTKIRELEE